MTSKEALNELFVEANRCSNAPYKYTTYDLLQFCKQIKEDLEVLKMIKQRLKINGYGKIYWFPYITQRQATYVDSSGTEKTDSIYMDWEEETIKRWLDGKQ